MNTTKSQLDALFNDIEQNQSIFEIPIVYNLEYFPDVVEKRLKVYYEFISRNNFGKRLNYILNLMDNQSVSQDIKVLTRIKGLIDSINSSISSYYNGLPNKAYESFSNSLTKIVKFQNHVALSYIEPNEDFYRIRPSSNMVLSERKDIFHVGFEYRNFCNTQRYSIPGLPSLYLGKTSYLCYQELGRPNVSESYISRFRSLDSIRVIDIQTVFSFIKGYNLMNNEKDKFDQILRYLLLFPLYLSSTIKVLHNESNFKTEYIIPQLLMQFVSASNTKESSIGGIRFPSTKLRYSTEEEHGHYSCVFPIVKSNPKGFCSFLSGIFNLTEPKLMSDILGFENIIDPFLKYSGSDFDKIDNALLKEKLDNVLK